MTLNKKISAFTALGEIFREAACDKPLSKSARNLKKVMDRQQAINRWFTPENVNRAVESLGNMLKKEKLEKWLCQYKIPDTPDNVKNIALIMASNIPLVGFHDLMCVLMSGHRVLIKASSKDTELIEHVALLLTRTEHNFSGLISFSQRKPGRFDAVIATGSNNTSTYFDYYFGSKPHIFRKNRNSIAILRGDETDDEIDLVGSDIFTYFGLGCRSVSKLFIPEGYDVRKLPVYWGRWKEIIQHGPYANNIDHQKALFLVNREPFLDAGFILFRENMAISSPIGVLHYVYYKDYSGLNNSIKISRHFIQIIVGRNETKPGFSQHPEPWEYADNRDTLQFLLSL